MPSAMEHLQTLNSFIRTLLALVVVGGVGTAGYYGYNTYTAAEREARLKEQQLTEAQKTLHAKEAVISQQTVQIADLNRDLEEKKVELQRLETALRLHKMERRLARVTVLDVGADADANKKFSRIEFVELGDQGQPLDEARQFRVEGDMVYVDYWVVKFEDKYVETADLERGTSICLFNRIFGEFQKPKEGFCLDEPGQRPGPYARGSVMSDFEKKIWDDFWSIANSPQAAAELGIRAIHGDAVSIKVIKGKTYRITVRASGGPEIEVEENGRSPQASISRDLWQPPRRAWPVWSPIRQSVDPRGPAASFTTQLAGK
jgi:hypothetical protein